MKGLKKLTKLTPIVLTAFMLVTPVFTPPKLPKIPNISGSITLPASTQEAINRSAEEAAKEAVKNLKIDWSKFNFIFDFGRVN